MRHAHGTIPFFALVAAGCLTRPVVSGEPTTKTNFTRELKQDAVDKVDLLFAIDNSRSMGDKQDYLSQAIPDLIERLVTPNCVDPSDTTKVVGVSHDDGVCDAGQAEFKPVHDLHIGIVSSSLGPRLGDSYGGADPNDHDPTKYVGVCDPTEKAGPLGSHNDDGAHLLKRAGADEHAVGAASSGFLAWFPAVKENDGKTGPANAITKVEDLDADFQALVSGIHQQGCGIESQLESWYRFLVQPDPYASLALQGDQPAWVGVDATILAQRKDFLRPDSLVAVVVLSDENDSEVDVRAVGGKGYYFMSTAFQPPRATAICATKPLDPGCMSCSIDAAKGSPECAGDPLYTAANDWGYDMNLRHVHMRQKYGVDPQFPIARYVDGLSKTTVADRSGGTCTNPLFAAQLPDGSTTDPSALCKLPAGPRDAGSVFYAHIGGVPHELLHFDPNDPSKSALTDDDWTKILGKDPESYDFTGIDPHMIESYAPRDGLAGPSSGNDADPIHGREWITDQGKRNGAQVDLEYACTFPLAAPRDCAHDTTGSCDCGSTGLTPEQTPPVCDPSAPTTQIKAKAYPTPRELLVAKKLGAQGIVSSICPIHVKEEGTGDPLYGYRPAVAAIVDRLKSKLGGQCLPRAVTPQSDGTVPCLVLGILPNAGAACDPGLGMRPADETIIAPFRRQEHDAWVANGKPGPDPATLSICAIDQLVGPDLKAGSCKGATKPGWCYVTGAVAAADQCGQEIQFTDGIPPNGVKLSLQCIEGTAAP